MVCRQVGLVQLAVVGGQLDAAMLDRDEQSRTESREEEQQLRVLILDNRGHLFLWQDTATQHVTRCAYLNKSTTDSHRKQTRSFSSVLYMNARFVSLDFCILNTPNVNAEFLACLSYSFNPSVVELLKQFK
jgi:hypothetical protein